MMPQNRRAHEMPGIPAANSFEAKGPGVWRVIDIF